MHYLVACSYQYSFHFVALRIHKMSTVNIQSIFVKCLYGRLAYTLNQTFQISSLNWHTVWVLHAILQIFEYLTYPKRKNLQRNSQPTFSSYIKHDYAYISICSWYYLIIVAILVKDHTTFFSALGSIDLRESFQNLPWIQPKKKFPFICSQNWQNSFFHIHIK